ncbi:MAG: penicillin-binding protein 2 [Ottowia sp.]|nr:penicillin-binding protein 2 [Ottowia sp.]
MMNSDATGGLWLRRNVDKKLAKAVGALKLAGVHVEREGEGRRAARHIRLAPQEVRQEAQKVAELANLLDMPEKELRAKMAEEREVTDKESGAKRMEKRPYVRLRRQVDVQTAQKIATLNVPGVQQSASYKRVYPEGEALAHVVGMTNIDDHGQEGVELAFEEQLAGRPGSQLVRVNKMGEAVEAIGERIPPVDGRDVQLSIDSRVQSFAYQTLRDAVQRNKARAGSVVVLDARSGEVLALANYPSYAPGDRRRLKEPPRNIAITDVFEPGSTMKPITVAMALEAKKVTPRTLINTAPGSYQLDRFTVRDTHNYGTLTVEGVIQKSSNIGSLKIAQRLTPQQMWETYDALGYGKRPDVRFPGAAAGRVRPWKSWRPMEQATMSYGYGLSASLFQIAHSYTAFSNDGRVIDATLLKVPEGQEPHGVQVFSPENTRAVRRMLRMAVEPGGTGQLAQTEGYSVGGKSGTARKQVGKGYSADRYRAWFTGLAPIEQPRVVVAVMIDEPSAGTYYGGAVAAPVFSQVVQHTLRAMGVPPDRAIKPEIVVAQEERGDDPM